MNDTLTKAVTLMENGQAEQALKLLKESRQTASDDEKFTIAEIYLQWGFLQEATEVLEALLKTYPDESELKITLADAYIELEDDASAITLLGEINETDPFYLQALVQLADLYQAQGLFEVAEQKLLTAKKTEPNEQLIDFGLGELYFSTGEYQKAILYYEKILPETSEIGSVSIPDRLGEAYAASGEYEKALSFFKDDESKDPDKFFKYGLTARQADREDIAINAWEHVIELDPYYHTVYYQLADAYEDEGMVSEAFQTAKKGLEFDEFNKELYFLTGRLAHQLDDNTESERLVREAIALDPDYKEAILFLIEFFKASDDYQQIVDLISEIKRNGADDSLYDWELASAYNNLESYEEALNAYRTAYDTLNKDSDFLKDYGYFLTEEGRMKEAISIFEQYLEQQPLDSDIHEYVERLKLSERGDV